MQPAAPSRRGLQQEAANNITTTRQTVEVGIGRGPWQLVEQLGQASRYKSHHTAVYLGSNHDADRRDRGRDVRAPNPLPPASDWTYLCQGHALQDNRAPSRALMPCQTESMTLLNAEPPNRRPRSLPLDTMLHPLVMEIL